MANEDTDIGSVDAAGFRFKMSAENELSGSFQQADRDLAATVENQIRGATRISKAWEDSSARQGKAVGSILKAQESFAKAQPSMKVAPAVSTPIMAKNLAAVSKFIPPETAPLPETLVPLPGRVRTLSTPTKVPILGKEAPVATATKTPYIAPKGAAPVSMAAGIPVPEMAAPATVAMKALTPEMMLPAPTSTVATAAKIPPPEIELPSPAAAHVPSPEMVLPTPGVVNIPPPEIAAPAPAMATAVKTPYPVFEAAAATPTAARVPTPMVLPAPAPTMAGAPAPAMAAPVAKTVSPEMGDFAEKMEGQYAKAGISSDKFTESLRKNAAKGGSALYGQSSELAKFYDELEKPEPFEHYQKKAIVSTAAVDAAFKKSTMEGLNFVQANRQELEKIVERYRFFGKEVPKSLDQAVKALDKYEKKVEQAGKSSKTMFGTVEQFLTRIKGIGVGESILGGLAIAVGKKTLDKAEATYKMAQEASHLTLMSGEADLGKRYTEIANVQAITGATLAELQKVNVALSRGPVIRLADFKEGAKTALELRDATGLATEEAGALISTWQQYYNISGKALDEQAKKSALVAKISGVTVEEQASLYEQLKYVRFGLTDNANATKNIADSTLKAAANMSLYGMKAEAVVNDTKSLLEGGMAEGQKGLQALILGGASPQEAMQMLADLENGVEGAAERIQTFKNQAAASVRGMFGNVPMGSFAARDVMLQMGIAPTGEIANQRVAAGGGPGYLGESVAGKQLAQMGKGGPEATKMMEEAWKPYFTAGENVAKAQEKAWGVITEQQKKAYGTLLHAAEKLNLAADKFAGKALSLGEGTKGMLGVAEQTLIWGTVVKMMLPQVKKLFGIGEKAVPTIIEGATKAAPSAIKTGLEVTKDAGVAVRALKAAKYANLGRHVAGGVASLGTSILLDLELHRLTDKLGDIIANRTDKRGEKGFFDMRFASKVITDNIAKEMSEQSVQMAAKARKYGAPDLAEKFEEFNKKTAGKGATYAELEPLQAEYAKLVKELRDFHVKTSEEMTSDVAKVTEKKTETFTDLSRAAEHLDHAATTFEFKKFVAPMSYNEKLSETPGKANVADIVKIAAAYGATATSTTGGKHVSGSKHYAGMAADIRTKDRTEREIEELILAYKTAGYKVGDERKPTGREEWSGPHLHVETTPKAASAERVLSGTAVASTAVKPYTGKTQGDESILAELRRANAILAQQLAVLQHRKNTSGAPQFSRESEALNRGGMGG